MRVISCPQTISLLGKDYYKVDLINKLKYSWRTREKYLLDSFTNFFMFGTRNINSRVLNTINLNPYVRVMEYAVRGPLAIRAGEIEKELEEVCILYVRFTCYKKRTCQVIK